MLATRWLVTATLALAITLVGTSSAQAQKLYTGSLVIESFGNDQVGGTGDFQYFSVVGLPQGQQCNPNFPRCPFTSTPVSMLGGNHSVLGSLCTPYTAWATMRPPPGGTGTTCGGMCVHYRNPAFFTASGQPNTTSCTAATTVGGSKATVALTTNSPLRGKVMKGAPLTGGVIATTTGGGPSFSFMLPEGDLRRTTLGDLNRGFPYVYSYTYATLRNSTGSFGPGDGPGDFSIMYMQGLNQVAKAAVTAGPNQFGGVMRLLGQLTTKKCYFRNGGCSLGGNNLRYDAIGTTPYTVGGVVTMGYQAVYTAMYYHTNLMQFSNVMITGARFPWTTGTASVSAQRGTHYTVERREGYDARNASGVGKIQLVSPVLTHWLQPAANRETAGIAILKLDFLPESRAIASLAGGLLGLLLLYRARRR